MILRFQVNKLPVYTSSYITGESPICRALPNSQHIALNLKDVNLDYSINWWKVMLAHILFLGLSANSCTSHVRLSDCLWLFITIYEGKKYDNVSSAWFFLLIEQNDGIEKPMLATLPWVSLHHGVSNLNHENWPQGLDHKREPREPNKHWISRPVHSSAIGMLVTYNHQKDYCLKQVRTGKP